MIKVLNLYAGIGGNRKLWTDVDVTAIEYNEEIANIYKKSYPQDNIIVTDAHQYLLDHYKEYDFIWSSPPCPSHSRTNVFLNAQGVIRYPDMNLYQEIILLKQFFKGLFVIENVIPYYEPLIKPTILLERHFFWSNFTITQIKLPVKDFNTLNARKETRQDSKEYKQSLENWLGIKMDFKIYTGKNNEPLTVLRNCVHPELGNHILNCALLKSDSSKIYQGTLFENIND